MRAETDVTPWGFARCSVCRPGASARGKRCENSKKWPFATFLTRAKPSERFDLPVSTLRYYDKEGLFPALTRTSGIRRFGEQELEALRVIECLKRSGLETKEIKQFMDWCAQGSETYPQRHALFVQQAERVEAEIERLQKSLDMIRFKCWYYEQAMRDGNEDRVHAMLPDQLPPDIQPIYDHAHET